MQSRKADYATPALRVFAWIVMVSPFMVLISDNALPYRLGQRWFRGAASSQTIGDLQEVTIDLDYIAAVHYAT